MYWWTVDSLVPSDYLSLKYETWRHEPVHAVKNENKSIINNFWQILTHFFTQAEQVHAPAAATAAAASRPARPQPAWKNASKFAKKWLIIDLFSFWRREPVYAVIFYMVAVTNHLTKRFHGQQKVSRRGKTLNKLAQTRRLFFLLLQGPVTTQI